MWLVEIKKSNKANLDNHRTTGFLLGLIIALALAFTAMETNFGERNDSDAEDHILDDLAKELNMAPAADQVEKQRAVKIPKKIDFDVVPEKTEPVVAPRPTLDKIVVSDQQQAEEPEDDERPVDPEKKPDLKINPPADPIPLEQLNEGERTVSDTPVPPGGWAEFASWIDKNWQYPSQAQSKKTEGNVMVGFVVNVDGSVSDIKIVGKADPVLAAEVLRLMRLMGKWKPGIENDVPCRTYVELPFKYKL